MVYLKPATLMHGMVDVLSIVIVVSRVVVMQMVYNSLFAVVYIPHQWQCIPHHSGGNYTPIVSALHSESTHKGNPCYTYVAQLTCLIDHTSLY